MPDLPLDLDRSPVFRLLVLVNLTARPFARLFERTFHISLSEWRVMLALASRPGLASAEVAEALGLDKMAVSRAVRGLEARGRVARRPDAADGRRATLELTAEGWALYGAIAPRGREREDALLAALDAADRATLDRLLDRLVASARRLPDG